MMATSSGCGLCPWSCSGKVGAYAIPVYTTCMFILIWLHSPSLYHLNTCLCWALGTVVCCLFKADYITEQ